MATLDMITRPEALAILSREGADLSNVDEDELNRLITAASTELVRHIGASVKRPIVQQLNGGGHLVELEVWPIASITSVHEWVGTTDLTITERVLGVANSNEFIADRKFGRLRRTVSGRRYRWADGEQNIVVDYIAGRADTTTDVSEQEKRACAITVRHLWEQDKTLGMPMVDQQTARPWAVPLRAIQLCSELVRPTGFA